LNSLFFIVVVSERHALLLFLRSLAQRPKTHA